MVRSKEEIKEYYERESKDRELRIERHGDLCLLFFGLYLLLFGLFLLVAGYLEWADMPIHATIFGTVYMTVGIWGTHKTIKSGTIFRS